MLVNNNAFYIAITFLLITCTFHPRNCQCTLSLIPMCLLTRLVEGEIKLHYSKLWRLPFKINFLLFGTLTLLLNQIRSVSSRAAFPNKVLTVKLYIYLYFTDPACISLGYGCFLAEQSCKRYVTYIRKRQ